MVDMWTPPSGATPQQDPTGRRLDDGMGQLAALLGEVRTVLRDVPNHLLQQAGIYVTPEGMTIDSRLRVTGDTVIEGSLDVPNAKIKNDWLENPVTFGGDYEAAAGFSVPAAWTEIASASITVPAGYTSMRFDATGYVSARNDSGATQYFMGRIYRQINGGGYDHNSVTDQQAVPNGFWSTVMMPYKWGEAVNPGDVHRFSLWTWTGSSWSADANHAARLDVSAEYTR